MVETLATMDSVVESRTARTSQGTATKTPTAAMTPIDRERAISLCLMSTLCLDSKCSKHLIGSMKLMSRQQSRAATARVTRSRESAEVAPQQAAKMLRERI